MHRGLQDSLHSQTQAHESDAVSSSSTSASSPLQQPPDCGSWFEGQDFHEHNLAQAPADSREECSQQCLSMADCNGVTWWEQRQLCDLKHIHDSAPEDVDSSAPAASMRLCSDNDSQEQVSDFSMSAAAPAGGSRCGEWLADYTFPGGEEAGVLESEAISKAECLGECSDSASNCNTAMFNFRTKRCHTTMSTTDSKPEPMLDWVSIQLCPQQASVDSECGVWISDGDFLGHEISGENRSLEVNRDACKRRCQQTEGCNAVTFQTFTQECCMKSLPADAGFIRDWESDALRLCPGDGGGVSMGLIAGVAAAAVGVLLLLSGLLCIIRRRQRRMHARPVKGYKCENVPAGSLPTDLQRSESTQGAKSAVAVGISKHCVSSGTAKLTVEDTHALYLTALDTEHPAGQNLQPGNQQTSSSANMFTVTQELREVSTLGQVSVLPNPSGHAWARDMMASLHSQLDDIQECHHGLKDETKLLDGLRFTGRGSRNRRQGGQAVVQMAASRLSRQEYAIKFFISRSAFEREKALYTGANPIRQFLPQVRSIVDNDDRALLDPGRHPLPPCIVMERGESLDLWSARNAPDRAQAFTVIYHIAQRLWEFHAAGYVHRDLKPGNVMWLPRTNRWTVIDFGCAARRKSESAIGYTLRYAAPEVIAAKRSGQAGMVVDEALDAWSLGVMAFEMCVGAATFPKGMPTDKIMDQIQGVNGEMLPWEGDRLTPRVKDQLQLFQGALSQLLHRNPSERPSMRQFARTCRRILGDHTED